MKLQFRKATDKDISPIWKILEHAIARRKADGSNQWQDGYPNKEIIASDIEKEVGFVLTKRQKIIGYCAILINDEPDYKNIDGAWKTNGDFVVFHRLAIAKDHLGEGYSQKIFSFIEDFASQHNLKSIKADTNFDNGPMLHVFDKIGYSYCGEVLLKGSPRKAFEKVL